MRHRIPLAAQRAVALHDLLEAAGSLPTDQPVSCGTTSPDEPCFTCQSGGVVDHDGFDHVAVELHVDRRRP